MLINMLWLPAMRCSKIQMIKPWQKRTESLVWQLSVTALTLNESLKQEMVNFSPSQQSPSTLASLFSRPAGMDGDTSSHFSSVIYSSHSSPKELPSPYITVSCWICKYIWLLPPPLPHGIASYFSCIDCRQLYWCSIYETCSTKFHL